METILLGIYRYFEKHRLVFFSLFLISLIALAFLASRIKLEEDISSVLPRDSNQKNATNQLDQSFMDAKFIDKLVLTVSLRDSNAVAPDSLLAYADALTFRLDSSLKPLIRKLNYKVDDSLASGIYQNLLEHLPVYLNQNDYIRIDSMMRPESVRHTLEEDIRILGTPSGLALKPMIINDPLGISFLALKKIQQLQNDENFVLYENAILTKDLKHLLLFIEPAYPSNNTGKNSVMLDGIDQIASQLNKEGFTHASLSYFGSVAVAAGNAQQLRKDSIFTLSLTIAFVLIFIGWYFRKKRAPILILVPALFGALFSLAMIYLLKGKISVIALGTGSIILGIAVSYSLHVFNHFRHTNDIRQVIRDLSGPLTIGSFTTIGGFLCLEFVRSPMLRDLGLFAAFSLIGASFCSLVFLPPLISIRNRPSVSAQTGYAWIDQISALRPERSRWLIGIIFGLTIIFAFAVTRVQFETDMTRMNYMSTDLQQAEAKLNAINAYSLKSVYLITHGADINDALQKNERMATQLEKLKQQNVVNKYSGVSSLIISDSLQSERISIWNRFWTTEKKQALLSTLHKEGSELKFNPTAFDAFENLLNKKFEPVSTEQTAEFSKNFFDEYISIGKTGATLITLVKTSAENKKLIYDTFQSDPDVSIIDKQRLTEEFVGLINADFTRIALLSSILVFVVLWITYGRIELTLVSFIPMFIAWIWILGIMGLAGIKFNIVNIILSALIFGLGDDYSLFIMDGLLQEYKTGKKNLSSFKSSIVLSAICTLAGLGMLIFAKHPALRSIAMVSIIGMFCVVLIAQTLIPFLFGWLIQNRINKGRFPWTFFGILRGIFAFVYFAFGCLVLCIAGLILIRLNPFNKEKGKLVYHKILSAYSWSMYYMMVNMKKKLINPLQENFSRPAVVISNHQSSLDIILMAMLHPKLILLTNNWVWNSPIFGQVVKLADYYPVSQGIENSIDLLASRIAQGYSIVVFPEGTRTSGDTLKRFHKGAFYLAEKLELDILPILIHGGSYTMSKGDLLLKGGRICQKFLPRISPSDQTFGTGYVERAKNIGRHFKTEYARLKLQEEQPSYFREQLIYNFIYKGPVLEWYLRIKIMLEKDYQQFHELLPANGHILDLGCGYGFMTYMLHFAAPARVITGIDYDEEKIEVANHCFSRQEGIQFLCHSALDFPEAKYDGIIMADLLHYLQEDEQIQLIEKCIGHLKAGGKLIIRDGNADLIQKQKGTALTEFFSTRLIGFNKTNGKGLSFLSGKVIRDLARKHQMDYEEKDETKYTSNMIFVLSPSPMLIGNENI